jgi:AraC-like DNA-binding protein
MLDGRVSLAGKSIPIATAVANARYCFPSSQKHDQKSPSLRLLCAGREQCLPGYHVQRSDFRCQLVELVVEGQGTVRAGGENREVFPGIVFSYGMDSQHEIWTSPDGPMTKYFAAFEANDFMDAGELQSIRWIRDLSTMQVLFEELIREGQRDGELARQITSTYLELILLKAREALPDDRIPQHHASKGRDLFERALACIETDYCELGGLRDLSRKVGVEPNYLCRLFRRFGQETPIQCLSRYKLNFAAELLLSQTRSVAEIATIVGYADQFYFSKVFKKRFGKSPNTFRNGHQGEG